jgi:hypothetical protein
MQECAVQAQLGRFELLLQVTNSLSLISQAKQNRCCQGKITSFSSFHPALISTLIESKLHEF